MIGNSGECGVVDKSTPHDANRINTYVHFCSLNYLNIMELEQWNC